MVDEQSYQSIVIIPSMLMFFDLFVLHTSQRTRHYICSLLQKENILSLLSVSNSHMSVVAIKSLWWCIFIWRDNFIYKYIHIMIYQWNVITKALTNSIQCFILLFILNHFGSVALLFVSWNVDLAFSISKTVSDCMC